MQERCRRERKRGKGGILVFFEFDGGKEKGKRDSNTLRRRKEKGSEPGNPV